DPRMVDPTLEPTRRPPNICYAGVPARANRSARGIAAACTLRSWLSMWSLRTAQTSAEPHLARIECPALIVTAEQDTGAYPPDAEVIWHVLRPLSGADLERATRCRLVHKLGAGVNTIDVDAATRLGIGVANMPGANAPSVAEGTVLLMLAALRRLVVLDAATR